MSASSPRRKKNPRSEETARPSPAVGEWVTAVVEEKPVGYVVQNLERAYGVPENKWTGWDVLDMLVAVIRDLLRQVRERHGSFDLSFLREMPAQEAVEYLSSFRGVGPKTAACTLLFACGLDVFPLDTHIFRILRRVGLIPAKCSDRFAHEVMNRVVPAGKFYSFHVNLIRHGRKLCRPRDPLCERCPIVEYCDYGQTRI
jgi:endonuclease III